MKRWPVVCLFAWAVAAALGADASLSELAPPGTKVTIGINLRKLLDSPLASEFGGADRDAAAKLTMKGGLAGLDPFKDVDQIWILMSNINDKAPALVVVRGRFDVEQLGRGAKRYKDVPMVEGGTEAGGVIGLISGQTIIGGETAQVQAAIDRIGSEHLGSELQERIAVAGSRYDIWGIGEIPEEPQATPPAPAQTGDAPSLASIDRFMFGLAAQQGLALTAEVHARTTEGAAQITAALSILEAGLKAQAKDGGVTFDVQQDNGTFRISVAVPEAVVRKAITDQKSSMAAAFSGIAAGAGAKDGAKPADAPAAPATVPAADPAPATPPVAAAAPPAPTLISPQPAAVAAPPSAPKPQTKPLIVKAPDGDTMIVRLPGAK